MNERLVERVKALIRPEDPILSEEEMVAALYSTVTRLNEQIAEARKHQIEVTIDVEYIRILDAYRPHDVMVGLKVAKLLNNRQLP
jgi:hypothetical protein